MKANALTLHWHTDNQPIYSAHFQPGHSVNNGRLATAGGDNNVRIWKVELSESGSFPSVTYLSTLSKHTQAVNVVRFDFKGEILASAGDDGNVILWTMADGDDRKHTFGEDQEESANDKETWRIKFLCRSSMAEIYDLAWSPDSQYLIAGSMDNVARIYNASTGLCVRQIAEHSHYVQGVAWDPLNEYLATQSSDRSVHIYTLKTKDGQFTLNMHQKISRAELPSTQTKSTTEQENQQQSSSSTVVDSPIASSAPETPTSATLPMNPPPVSSHSRRSSFGNSSSTKRSPSPSTALPLPAVRQLDSPKLSYRMAQLYHNEGLTSFFRRLTFSPDGSLLLTPAGHFKLANASGVEESTNTVYIYTRAGLNKPPVAHLPSLKKPAIVVKCSPLKYRLRKQPSETQNITIDTSDSSGQLAQLTESVSKMSSSAGIPSTSPKTPNQFQQAFALPYRLVYAVATQDSVFVYDTQQTTPLCIVANLHYATFTDLTWSIDGQILFMTSTDGFCSVIVFDKDELGEVWRSDIAADHSAYDKATLSETETYLPTPASTDSNSDCISKNTDRLTPTISPVPSVASDMASSSAATVYTMTCASTNDLRDISQSSLITDKPTSNKGIKREAKDENGSKKKKRIAPMLIGDVRR
ncbi:WD40-repeat-containing domain protein [Dipodascopsis uninucleata]